MDPQQPAPDETDDVTGHQRVHLDGGTDGPPEAMSRQHMHLDGDEADDVEGHLSGALGSKKNDHR